MNNPAPLTAVASPFHPGEQRVQSLAGVRERAENLGLRMLTSELVDAQRAFFASLPFVVTSQVDATGQPWAGLATGEPGFIQVTPDGRVRVRRSGAEGPAVFDASSGDAIGFLGIDFARRRRNRLNGTVVSQTSEDLTLKIDQGFGNCPKYINKRPWDTGLFSGSYVVDPYPHVPVSIADLVRRTNTFFIASSSGPRTGDGNVQPGAWGVDVSHRGGEPGFLRQGGEVLSFDDYPGNNLFNTLGNLSQYPRCGLLIPDFDSGDLVQLAGRAALHHDGNQYRVAVTVREVRHWRHDHA